MCRHVTSDALTVGIDADVDAPLADLPWVGLGISELGGMKGADIAVVRATDPVAGVLNRCAHQCWPTNCMIHRDNQSQALTHIDCLQDAVGVPGIYAAYSHSPAAFSQLLKGADGQCHISAQRSESRCPCN